MIQLYRFLQKSLHAAILAANMETALNALWDSGAGPGDRIVIVGAGAVGLLVTSLAARLPGSEVIVCDINPAREAIARTLGASFSLPDALGEAEADVVFHASATPSGLATALLSAGFEASIIELSWYGSAEVPAPLGSAFHSKRLRLISSQVGAVSGSRRPRWTHTRRLAKALSLLVDDRLDLLITDEVAFDELPDALPELLAPRSPSLVTAVRYTDKKNKDQRKSGPHSPLKLRVLAYAYFCSGLTNCLKVSTVSDHF